MAKTSMEIFLNTNTQQILYSQKIENSDIINYLKNLSRTTMVANPSIDSIVLYNRNRGEWYHSPPADVSAEKELKGFIESQQSIPRLKPMLRKVQRKKGGIDVTVYLFSYFMYQFSDPVSGKDSYIVLNEDASWFINNLSSIRQTENFINSFYMVNESGILYESSNFMESETKKYLVDDFFVNQGESGERSRHYTARYKKEKYVLSSVQLGVEPNYLLIIRNYDDVFRDLINMRRDYSIFGSMFLILIVFTLVVFSRSIYFPFKAFIGSISENYPDLGLSPQIENEFEYLRNIYKNAGELSGRLSAKSVSNDPAKENDQLYNYLNNKMSYEDFKHLLPDSRLNKNSGEMLHIVLLRINHSPKRLCSLETEDVKFLIDAVQNIVSGIFDDASDNMFFLTDPETVCIITDRKNQIQDFIEKCRLAIKRHLNINVFVSCCKAQGGVRELPGSYVRALDDLNVETKKMSKNDGQHDAHIDSIIGFVLNNYKNKNLSSRMVGDYLGLSNRYIMHKFKENTGITLNDHIVNVRMRKAANLLLNTDLAINKIAPQIGIESDTYFYTLFKKVYHCTPREFSERFRGEKLRDLCDNQPGY
jgi:AraC-like DNA-binding protein